MPEQVSFFDTASRLTGWTSGTGECVPECGAFKFPQVDDDLGELGWRFRQAVLLHIDRYRPSAIGYESPLLLPHDDLLKVRKLYGLGFELETICKEKGIPPFEKDCRDLKRELTGNRHASKDDMVHVALKVGLNLPDLVVDGRRDAADSFAGWLLGIRDLNPALSRRWDSLIYGRRGGLL